MAESTTVRWEVDGPVAVVRIARPEVRNAVDGLTAEQLADAFRAFDTDDALAVAVLTGADGTFCAGADLKAFRTESGNRVNDGGDGPMGPSRMMLSKPVLAAVEGYAVAGGLELAIWCDLRIAARNAVFGVFCRPWGVPLVDGGTLRLPRLIGQSHALDLILTGRGVSGDEALRMGLANRLPAPGTALAPACALGFSRDEALRMGLANRLVDPGTALAAACDLARALAKHPQLCLRSDRRSAYEQWSLDEHAALANEFRLGRATIESGETQRGAARFRSGAGRHGSFE